MMRTRILAPLVFARARKNGRHEVRLITCTSNQEVRVYSRSSALDVDGELRLPRCQVYAVTGTTAPKFAHDKIGEWMKEEFFQIPPAGRSFEIPTRTLSEGVLGVMSKTLLVMPGIRAPWWFT